MNSYKKPHLEKTKKDPRPNKKEASSGKVINVEGIVSNKFVIRDPKKDPVLQNKVMVLFNQIETLAQKKNFRHAEKLREKLFELAPTAVCEIYESGKIIEKERELKHGVESMKNSSINRRMYRRFPIEGVITVQLMTKAGTTWGQSFNGLLANISQGGLSFEFQAQQSDPATLLTGKMANLILGTKNIKSTGALTWSGTIVGVNHIREHLYSVHIRGVKITRSLINVIFKLQHKKKQ